MKAAQLIDDTDWDEIITNDVSQSFVCLQERFLEIIRECIPMTIVKKMKLVMDNTKRQKGYGEKEQVL